MPIPVKSQLDLPQGDSYILDSFLSGPFGVWTPSIFGSAPVSTFGCDRSKSGITESAGDLDLSSSNKAWIQFSAMTSSAGSPAQEYGSLQVTRGTGSYKAGFQFVYRFSFPGSTVTKMFLGLRDGGGPFASFDPETPSVMLDSAGVVIDQSISGNQQMNLVGYDATNLGSPTLTGLGTDYSSSNNTKLYQLELSCAGSGASVIGKLTAIPIDGSGSPVSTSSTFSIQPRTGRMLKPVLYWFGASAATIRNHGMFLQGFLL